MDDVVLIARALMTATYGRCNVTDWNERDWNPSVAQAWDAATAALSALNLPARDAANVAKGLEMAAEIAASAPYPDEYQEHIRIAEMAGFDWASDCIAAAIRAMIEMKP